MSEEEKNKTIVRRFIEERRDPAVVAELVAEDYVSHTAGPRRPAGRTGVTQIRTLMHDAFPDVQWTIEDLIAEGDMVVARATMHGTHLGEVFGIPLTGRQVMVTGIHMYRIVRGKIVEGWLVRDTLGLLHQIGAVPTFGGPAS